MGRGAGLSSWEAGRRLRQEASSFYGQHSSGSWDPGRHPQTQVSFLLAAFPRAKSPVLEVMANPSTFPGQDRLTRRGYLLPSSSNLKAHTHTCSPITLALEVTTPQLALRWTLPPDLCCSPGTRNPSYLKLSPDLLHHPSYVANSL